MRHGRVVSALLGPTIIACTAAETPRGVVRGPVGERLDAFVRDSVPDFSGQVLVARDGEIVLHEGYGLADRRRRRPVHVGTIFDAGSITKQFTAAAIMALVEDGLLAVTDTLGQFLPELHGPAAGFTIHQLLTHTAGVPEYSGGDYEPRTAEAFIAWLDAVTPVAAPGERFEYSNPGYSALALVVERLAGRPYEGYLAGRLLARAGLESTGYVLPDWQKHDLAVGYGADGSRFGTPLDRFWHEDGPSWNLRGNGGILTTAGDLYRWQRALVGGLVLDPASVAAMTHGHVPLQRPDRAYGYGWTTGTDSAGRTVTDHTGGNNAFIAIVRWYEEPDLVIVVMSNSFDAAAFRAVLAAVVRVSAASASD